MTTIAWLLCAVMVLARPATTDSPPIPRHRRPERSGQPVAARLVGGRAGRSISPETIAVHVDLVAAVLDSGAPVSRALTLVAGVSSECVELPSGPGPSVGRDSQRLAEVLRQTARLLELGADPAAAWAPCAAVEGMRPVAAAAIRTSASGALLASSLRTSAATLRRDRQASALVRAQRVGVLAMLPLGLCFLPAFLCIGVVPTVVAIMARALTGTAISP